jgi:hypothetical protein
MRKHENPSTSVYATRFRAGVRATDGGAGAGAGTLVAGTTVANEVTAVAAVRAAKVFLFWLPSGWPHRRGAGGVAATCSVATAAAAARAAKVFLFWLPGGWP